MLYIKTFYKGDIELLREPVCCFTSGNYIKFHLSDKSSSSYKISELKDWDVYSDSEYEKEIWVDSITKMLQKQKLCLECNGEVRRDASFCSHCGKELS